jgi:hypothetical protein
MRTWVLTHLSIVMFLLSGCIMMGSGYSVQQLSPDARSSRTRSVHAVVSATGWLHLSAPNAQDLDLVEALRQQCRSRRVEGIQAHQFVRDIFGIAQIYYIKGMGECIAE